MAQYDWDKIKADYETGKYSMIQLSEKYGFHKRYGQKKAKDNGWEKGKLRKEIQKKVEKEVKKELEKEEIELRIEYSKILALVKEKWLEEFKKDKPDFNKMKSFKISTEIMQNLRKEEWEIYGIQEVAKKIQQEIDDKTPTVINIVGADEYEEEEG